MRQVQNRCARKPAAARPTDNNCQPQPRHCERSEAIQLFARGAMTGCLVGWSSPPQSWIASSLRSQRKRSAFVAGNDGTSRLLLRPPSLRAQRSNPAFFLRRKDRLPCGLELPFVKLDCFVASLLAMTAHNNCQTTSPSLRAQRSNPAFCSRRKMDGVAALAQPPQSWIASSLRSSQ